MAEEERSASLLGDARPSRTTSIVVALAGLATIALAIGRAPRKVEAPPPSAPMPEVAGPPGPSPADQLASAMAELEKLPAASPPPLEKLRAALENAGLSDKGWKLPDGRTPPPLPADAPKRVRFGVILVRYQGAQLAPSNAPTREAARARIDALLPLARTDFAAAAKQGDVGSAADIGTVQRGILEPGTQYVLFTLPPGGVSEVLDTPRGFWIVRRIQ